jgi:hypothetical protein
MVDKVVKHLEISYLVVEMIIEYTEPEAILYLEREGVSLEEYVEKLLNECDKVLVGSLKSIKTPEVYLREFTERWENYLMENEFAYFLASAMRGVGVIEEGPQIRLAVWQVELAFLLEIHPVSSLNISRGQGKSWLLLGYLMFLSFRYKKKKGSKFTKYSMAENLLIFAGEDLSKQHVKQLTSWAEGNYILWNRLAKGKNYAPSATILRFANGAQVIAKSFMSASRGFRGSLMIDDYNLEEYNTNSEVQDKVFDRITKALFPIASNPFSQIVMAATPVSPTDLIQRIWKDGGSKIHKFEYRAIESDGSILDYNLQPLNRIMERRETYSKRAFLQEIMLIADIEIDRIFTWDILNKTKCDSYSYSNSFKNYLYSDRSESVFCGLDFSFSTSDTSDYNAFATISWDLDIFGEGMFRLFNLFYKQVMSIPQQVRKIEELYRALEVDLILAESNGAQVAIAQQLIEMGLNVQKMNTTSKFKLSATQGIPILATVMDMGYLKFPYATEEDRKTTDMILQQFYNMIVTEKVGRVTKFEASSGNHDDIVLAVSQAILGSKVVDTLKLINGNEAEDWNIAVDREERMREVMLGED